MVGGAVGVVSDGPLEENGSSSSENNPRDWEVGGAVGGASEGAGLSENKRSKPHFTQQAQLK